MVKFSLPSFTPPPVCYLELLWTWVECENFYPPPPRQKLGGSKNFQDIFWLKSVFLSPFKYLFLCTFISLRTLWKFWSPHLIMKIAQVKLGNYLTFSCLPPPCWGNFPTFTRLELGGLLKLNHSGTVNKLIQLHNLILTKGIPLNFLCSRFISGLKWFQFYSLNEHAVKMQGGQKVVTYQFAIPKFTGKMSKES